MSFIKKLALAIAVLSIAAPAFAKPLQRTLRGATDAKSPIYNLTIGSRRPHVWTIRPTKAGPDVTLVVIGEKNAAAMKVTAYSQGGKRVPLGQQRFANGSGSWYSGYLPQNQQPAKIRITAAAPVKYQIREDTHP